MGVLNFASARNPGGGFLGGSEAQEESLARSSALYESLSRFPQYYESHRREHSLLYSDAMIVSPACPVIRDEGGALLDEPVSVTFITSPAPNAGAIAATQPGNGALVRPVLERRAEQVLAVAAHEGCTTLILGAWGCGVFRNDPTAVARAFARQLGPGGRWRQHFERVVFSVLDRSAEQQNHRAFQQAFP